MSRTPSRWSRLFRPRLDRLEGREVPAVFTVTTASDDPLDPGLTLRKAITAANAAPGADEIRFALPPNSTITVNPTASVAAGPQGPLPAVTEALTITGGAGGLTLSGNNQVRLFRIDTAAVTITDLTLADGKADTGNGNFPTPTSGGAIYTRGPLALTSVVLSGNTAVADGSNPSAVPTGGDGGAVFADGATVTLDRTRLRNNTAVSASNSLGSAGGNGGAVAVVNGRLASAAATTDAATLSGNEADAYGGAVSLTAGDTGSGLVGQGFVFQANTASLGGAVAVSGFGTVQLQDSTFAGNTAPGGTGGGLYLDDAAGTLDRLTFTGNTANYGGGLAVVRSDPNPVLAVTRSTFDGNTAGLEGGGVYVLRNFSSPALFAQVDLEDVTVTRNAITLPADGSGGGLVYRDPVQDGTPSIVRLTNSIVAGNTNAAAPDVAGAFQSRGVNLFSSTLGGSGFSTADLVAADPLLSPLGDYGGPTRTAPPTGGSPALGAADAGVSAAALTTDQRGKPRTTPRAIGAVQPQRPTGVGGDGPYTFPFNGGTAPAPGVLANDVNNDQLGPLTAVLVAIPPTTAGSVTLNPDGSFTFTPVTGFSGQASFIYAATDGVTTSDNVTVLVTVVVNPPTAVADRYTTPPGQTLTVAAPGVVGNDRRGDGSGPLTTRFVSPLAPADAGTLSVAADGGFVFTPRAGFTGQAGFNYQVNDGLSTSPNPALVLFNVVAPPTAVDDRYTVPAGGLFVPAPGVLANDVRNGGTGALNVTLASGVSSGTLFLNPDGSFAYTPAAGASGLVTFRYTVTDSAGASNPATVTLDLGSPSTLIAPARSYGPVAAGATLTVAADEGLLSGVTAGPGRTLRVINATPAVGSGTLAVAADGGFTFTPPADAQGTATFTYQLADDAGQTSAPGTVTVAVLSGAVPSTGRVTAYSSGAGRRAEIRVVRPGLADLTLKPFEDSFLGGARVAVADLNRDGYDDIVAGAGPGGGPRVIVYDGLTGAQIGNFYAFEDTFRGGAHVAAADSVRADGSRTSLLVVGAGSFIDRPGSPRVRAFRDFDGIPQSGTVGTAPIDFLAYSADFRGGVRVAAGDLDGDGVLEIVTIAGPSGGPDLRVWDTGHLTGTVPAQRQQLNGLGDPTDGYRGGAFVAVSDGAIYVTPDSFPELAGTFLQDQVGAVTTDTVARRPSVSVFAPTGSGSVRPTPTTVDLGDPDFLGGVRVSAAATVLVGYGPGGRGKVRQLPLTNGAIDVAGGSDSFPLGDLGPDVSVYVATAPLPALR